MAFIDLFHLFNKIVSNILHIHRSPLKYPESPCENLAPNVNKKRSHQSPNAASSPLKNQSNCTKTLSPIGYLVADFGASLGLSKEK